MAQTILLFDFGTNEEAAQQARHRIEGWKQAFRLGNKVQFKFERQAPKQKDDSKAKGKSSKKEPEPAANGRVRMLVRLDFSNHEKHLFHQWLDRIPGEEPFKSVKGEAVHHPDAGFEKMTELFDSLD